MAASDGVAAGPPPVVRRQSAAVVLGLTRNDMFMMKLMRLPSPGFALAPAPARGPSGVGAAGGAGPFALGPELMVTSSLGSMYLGERFRVCFSVTHRFGFPLRGAGFRVEVQTSRTRTVLLDTTRSGSAADMPRGETRDYVLEHEITELEDNNLVCTAVYYDDMGRQQQFQKFFIVKVALPLDLRGSLHQNDDVMFAELRVTNLVPEPVFLERVALEPMPRFTCQDVSDAGDADHHGSDAGRAARQDRSLRPQASRSFLFRAMPRDPLDRSSVTVGTFTVRWRSAVGKTGVLRTATISRAVPPPGVFLTLMDTPAEATLERPFSLRFQLRNRTDRDLPLRLHLVRERMSTVMPHGVTSRSLGTVEAGGTAPVSVDMLPLGLGLQRVSGLTVRAEDGSNDEWNFDDVHEILVSK